MSIDNALELASEQGLDLVKVAANVAPPVCKIMDYGKFKFELAKKKKESKKNQKNIDVKEIQLSPSIGVNDFNIKCGHAVRFLKNGNKVKVTVKFRGREVTHSEIGERLLVRFAEQLSEYGTLDREPTLEGRHMTIFLSAKP